MCRLAEPGDRGETFPHLVEPGIIRRSLNATWYSVIDDPRALMDMLGKASIEALRRLHKTLVEKALPRAEHVREGKWTENIAVGSRNFVEIIKGELGMKAKGRRISGTDEDSGLREPQASYSNDFEANNGLRNEWRVKSEQ